MRTMRKINRPIKFFGLTSGQFGLFMLANALIIIVCIFKHVHPVIIVSVMGGIFFASGILFKNLKREHKAGNPDYLTGLSVRSASPKQIIENFESIVTRIRDLEVRNSAGNNRK